jgi:hypothetical protein
MTTEIRIIRTIDPSALPIDTLDKITEAYFPPRRYATGTIRAEHDFVQAGNYLAVVTVRDGTGRTWIANLPFSIGGMTKATMTRHMRVLLPLAGGFLICVIYAVRRRHPGSESRKDGEMAVRTTSR